jgi:predicted methyltransferase
MRIGLWLLTGSTLALIAIAASAQQQPSDWANPTSWNNPSVQQQQDTKNASKNAKDGLNNIGQQEENMAAPSPTAPEQMNYSNPSSSDADNVHSQVHDALQQGGSLLDSIPNPR